MPMFRNDPAETPDFESRILPQVLKSIEFAVTKGHADDGEIDRVKVALNPPGLGELALDVTRSETGFRVSIIADRLSTHVLLERNIEALASSLELSHGEVEVDVSRRHSRDPAWFTPEPGWASAVKTRPEPLVEAPLPTRPFFGAGRVDLYV